MTMMMEIGKVKLIDEDVNCYDDEDSDGND